MGKRGKPGRPSYKITPELLSQVEQLAARGLAQYQIAATLGWSVETLCLKKRLYSEFSEAIKRGQAKGLAHVANNLFTQSDNGNVAATIFYLKNRDPENWKDRVEVKSDQTINNIDDRIKKRMEKLKK